MKHFFKHQFKDKFLGFMMALLWASVITACGGGGGSGGNVNGVPSTNTGTATADAKAASIIITVSSDTMASVGGKVDFSVLVKDANNNVVPGATVAIKSDFGVISRNNATRMTDANGLVSETLTNPGDSTERVITITAAVGSVAPVTKQVQVIAARPTLLLTSSSGTLDSAGAAGTEATITALVRDAGNNVIKDVAVELSADNGASLTNTKRTTNENGVVTEKLSTGGDPTKRTIKVKAKVAGAEEKTIEVLVAGHQIKISTNGSANLNLVSKVSAILTDSAGKPIPGVKMSFSALINPNGISESGTGKLAEAVTDSQGQVQLDFKPSTGPSDTITVSALGVTEKSTITVNTLTFTVTALDANNAALTSAYVNDCVRFRSRITNNGTPVAGSVTLNSSRGNVYSNATCTTALAAPVTMDANGDAFAYVLATTPGNTSLVSNLQGSSPATSTSELEFVAKLVSTANISLQVDPAVVSTGKPSTLKAVVRDGTALNNLVKNATVVFSIVSDPSGGTLAQPSVVKTGSDGSASVVYTGGAVATSLNGVTLQAKIQDSVVPESTGKNPARANLTVSGQSLFISAGTGNTISPGSSTANYTTDYIVYVTDATGNAVNNATITASVLPRTYYKGVMQFVETYTTVIDATTVPPTTRIDIQNGPWHIPFRSGAYIGCNNEDTNGNGILDPGEDINNSGRLEPGIPVVVTSSQTTNANGTAVVTLSYPKDRAFWTTVDITIRARVQGTEATYVAYAVLPGLDTDYGNSAASPPGQISPYGSVLSCNSKF